jgi:hypothetical protein
MATGVFHHHSTPVHPNAETLICRNSLSYIDSIVVQEEPHPSNFTPLFAHSDDAGRQLQATS